MKTAVIGRSAMTTVFRASLLCVFAASLLSLGCATPPKPRELDALEKLRANPEMPAARKKRPICARRPTRRSARPPTSGTATI